MKLDQDPDLGQDTRMMVPVFFDKVHNLTKVWVLLGWSTVPLEVAYAHRPAARIFDPAGQELPGNGVDLHFHAEAHTAAYPVVAELYVKRLLDRAEFRQLCDAWKYPSAILEHLK
jgi:hypothetical protein